MATVEISAEKFEELVRDSERLKILSEAMEEFEEETRRRIRNELFEDFVKSKEFPIDREVCGKFLGFEV